MSDLPTILFVAVPAPMGGSNRSLATVLASLDGKVNRVLASPSFGAFRDVVEANGLAEELIDLPRKPGSYVDRWLRIVGGLKVAAWVLRNRSRVTAIHANALTGLNLSIPGAILSRRPVVVWVHDPIGSKWGRFFGPIIRRLMPDLRIAAVSRTAEAVAVENGLCARGDAEIIPNPISADEVLATRVARDPDALTIGLLGGTSARKGFDLLPAVAGQLLDQPVRWKLFMARKADSDSGSVWAKIDRLPDGLVSNPGRLTNVAEAYAQTDKVFCPSRNASFCRVAAEAMMNGLPVVASDIRPLQDLLGDDQAGILFPTGNSDAAVAAIKALANNPAMRERMGEEGRLRSKDFMPEGIARQLMNVYGIDT